MIEYYIFFYIKYAKENAPQASHEITKISSQFQTHGTVFNIFRPSGLFRLVIIDIYLKISMEIGKFQIILSKVVNNRWEQRQFYILNLSLVRSIKFYTYINLQMFSYLWSLTSHLGGPAESLNHIFLYFRLFGTSDVKYGNLLFLAVMYSCLLSL